MRSGPAFIDAPFQVFASSHGDGYAARVLWNQAASFQVAIPSPEVDFLVKLRVLFGRTAVKPLYVGQGRGCWRSSIQMDECRDLAGEDCVLRSFKLQRDDDSCETLAQGLDQVG